MNYIATNIISTAFHATREPTYLREHQELDDLWGLSSLQLVYIATWRIRRFSDMIRIPNPQWWNPQITDNSWFRFQMEIISGDDLYWKFHSNEHLKKYNLALNAWNRYLLNACSVFQVSDIILLKLKNNFPYNFLTVLLGHW